MVLLTQNIILSRTKKSRLSDVHNLNIWGNDLTDLSILSQATNLTILSLSVNSISTLAWFTPLTQLQELYLRKNLIPSPIIPALISLMPLKNLRVLWLLDNPCAYEDDYRLKVIAMLPNLTKLDEKEVEDDERQEADRRYGREREGATAMAEAQAQQARVAQRQMKEEAMTAESILQPQPSPPTLKSHIPPAQPPAAPPPMTVSSVPQQSFQQIQQQQQQRSTRSSQQMGMYTSNPRETASPLVSSSSVPTSSNPSNMNSDMARYTQLATKSVSSPPPTDYPLLACLTLVNTLDTKALTILRDEINRRLR